MDRRRRHRESFGRVDRRSASRRWRPSGAVGANALSSAGMVDLDGAFDHPAADGCRSGPAGAGTRPVPDAHARLCVPGPVRRDEASAVDGSYPIAGAARASLSAPNLRVRSAPGLTSERHELLRDGTSVWVLDGPVIAADFEWFQVLVPSIDAGAGAPRIGWVAASDHGAERWLTSGSP